MLYTSGHGSDEGMGTGTFFSITGEGISNKRKGGRKFVMVDMGLAVKIAAGGFGVVFFLLTILWITIGLTRVVAEKITKIMNK